MTADPAVAEDDPPYLQDDGGYCVTSEDLDFLRIAAADLRDMLLRVRPLGMSEEEYLWFADDLRYALTREGVTDADLRLQGSAAHFWSGRHKSMPYSREEVFEELSKNGGRWPEGWELDRCVDTLLGQWPEPSNRPTRRPFDVMYRANLDADPSDYDVQISSDQMVERIRIEAERRGLEPSRLRVNNVSYGFIEKRMAVPAFKYVAAWADRATNRLGRPVTWAVFASTGPNKNETNELLSSHFKESDWVLSDDTACGSGGATSQSGGV